jgi:methionyl aminopeptidase
MDLMQEAGRISALALRRVGEAVAPGVSTAQLDEIAEATIRESGATPAFLGYGGFPASICASINEEVVHGIPRTDRVLWEGDIITIDVGAVYKGYVGDTADTFAVGRIDENSQRLIDLTRKGLYAGIEQCRDGKRLGDVCAAIGAVAKSARLGIIREYTGHGVGAKMHEDPSIPNWGTRGTGPKLKTGMTLAIEPMFSLGNGRVEVLDDGWTVVARDGARCAQIEHTVAITADGPEILTKG